ncbi:MAG: BatA domain-containing protein [Pirellulales bacterium]|nr:BatA domain-containing protein [Pirellulales bacterium]
MTFLTPLFLIAAVAGTIPVILHMINRQKAREVPFSTLRFLRISVKKTRRKQRIHDILLMLLRAAVLVLIAVGLAAPTLTSLPALLGSGSGSAVAIILDNSASMGTIDEGNPRFETARKAAYQILDQLEDGDQVALFLTGGPAFPEQGRLDRTHERVRQMLAAARVSHERADLGVAVQQARALLTDTEAGHRQIYIISDMQKLSWESLAKSQPAETDKKDQDEEIPVIIVDCNRAPKPNVAVAGVRLEAPVPVAGLPITATVELFNSASVPQKRLLELYTDGSKRATSPALEIPAGGRVRHDFQFSFELGGLHRGEVRLSGEDGCPLDDRRFFAIDIDRGIPVAVVKNEKHEIPYLEDTFYLEQALSAGPSGGSALQLTTLTAADLPSEPLSQYKIVYCVNLPAPSSEAADRLARYVENGGNLFWIAGDRIEPEAYNNADAQTNNRLLPARLGQVRLATDETITATDDTDTDQAGKTRDSWNIAQLDKEYPAFETLLDPAALYRSVLVYQHVSLEKGSELLSAAEGGDEARDKTGLRVLARLDDGQPILVERSLGHGKILMLGTSVHTGWTNLPLRPIFLPMMVRIAFELTGAEQGRYQALAGAPLVLQFDKQSQPVGVEVIPPSGETIRVKTTQPNTDTSSEKTDQDGTETNTTSLKQSGQTFRYTNTHTPGIYLVKPLEASELGSVAFSVNIDPDEAESATVEREDLKNRLGVKTVIFAENPYDLSETFDWLRQGRGMWEFFLFVVLLGLVFETFLSNWFSPKESGEQGEQ